MNEEAAGLAAALFLLKQEEVKIKKERIEAEEALITILGVKEEGAETHKSDAIKVTVTGTVIRSLDQEKWRKIKSSIPASLRPTVEKATLDIKGVKWLQANEPKYYKTFAKALTSKPGKTSVKVVEI